MDRLLLRALAAISLAMGLCLVAPEKASQLFGLGDRPRLIAAIGARDLAIGLGLAGVLPGSLRLWLSLLGAANVVDGTFVADSLRRGAIARGRGLAWLGLAVVGVISALCLGWHPALAQRR